MITVCIVDDHTALSDGVKMYLEKDGDIQVIAVKQSGKDLLACMVLQQPDVLITDISMPFMDGYELCKRVKESFPNVKVIALSMFEHKEAVSEMIANGVDGYVLKSSSLAFLKKAICHVVSGAFYYDPNLAVEKTFINVEHVEKAALSRSEREILILIAQGKSSIEISQLRGSAVSTIHKHRKNILHKLNLEGKGELYKYALKRYGHNS